MDISLDALTRRSDYLIGLSSDDIIERRDFIGASDANTICSGDAARVLRLWEEKSGLKDGEDLSNVLPVQMGTWTEDLNLMWFEKQTGRIVTHRKAKVVHPGLPFLRASLDGKTFHPDDASVACVIDAKHVNAFSSPEECLKKYAPQLAVQMACTDSPYGLLSIFFGNNKWEWIGNARDPLYESQVISACKIFWAHVKDGTPPSDIPSAEPPLPVSMMRSVDMSTSNMWGACEADFIANEGAAKDFDKAKSSLKMMVEDDVREAKGRILTIRRGKTGSLTFSRTKTK